MAAGVPLPARAQQVEPMRRVAVLMAYAQNDPEAQARVATLSEELRKLGWTEGRNIRIDTRWATDDKDKIRRLAQELATAQPDVIVSSNSATTAALLQQTRTIAIVFATVVDPVGSGFVQSLPRPGGNATGFVNIDGAMSGKWLELLREIAPRIKRAAFIYNPATVPFADLYLGPFKAAAASLALEGLVAPVRDTAELEATLAAQARSPDGGFIVMPGPFMANRSVEIIALAARHRLPAVYPFDYYAERGGLMSYGNDQADNYRQVALYVDRILKGAKPRDLPVQAPVKFDLTINARTAKALGLAIPPALLARADAVIE